MSESQKNDFYVEYLKNKIFKTVSQTSSNKKNENIVEKVKKDLNKAFEKANQNFFCPKI